MDPQIVRKRAEAFCAALVAGDMDRAFEELSKELHSNLGSLVAMLPLPLTEAAVESVEAGGSGYVVVLDLLGENDETHLQTRWKERDGRPTIVEISHIAETPVAAPPPDADADAEN
jgi:hypothetical protein